MFLLNCCLSPVFSVAPQRHCCRAALCRTSRTCPTAIPQGVFRGVGVAWCKGVPPWDLAASLVQGALVLAQRRQGPLCLWTQLTDGPRRRTCWHRKRTIPSCLWHCMISRLAVRISSASRKVRSSEDKKVVWLSTRQFWMNSSEQGNTDYATLRVL